MNIKHIISTFLLLIYCIILTHSIIPHHHHDLNNHHETCSHDDRTQHNHESQDHNSDLHETCSGFCILNNHKNNANDCEDACHFVVEIFRIDILASYFIQPSEIKFCQLNNSNQRIYFDSDPFVNTELYYSFASLRAPPIFHIWFKNFIFLFIIATI